METSKPRNLQTRSRRLKVVFSVVMQDRETWQADFSDLRMG